MIEKIFVWLYWNFPVIITRKKLKLLQNQSERKCSFELGSVLSDLEELKKNTWDRDRVEKIKNSLKHNFEKEDSKVKKIRYESRFNPNFFG